MSGAVKSLATPTSNKRKRVENERNSLLLCPVCMVLFEGHVYQCPGGHVICEACKNQINDSCPTCRRPLGNIRNLLAEQMADSLDRPCGFGDCSFEGNKEEVTRHRQKCKQRPYECPCEFCDWKGGGSNENALIDHLEEQHGSKQISSCRNDANRVLYRLVDVTGNRRMWTNYFHHQDNTFFFTVKRDDTNFFHLFVQSLVEGETTTISVSRSGRTRTFTSPSRSIREKFDDVMLSEDCLMLSEHTALYMSKRAPDAQQSEDLEDLDLCVEIVVC